MNIGNTRLGRKLVGSFILMCAIGAIVSGIVIHNIAKINESGDKS